MSSEENKRDPEPGNDAAPEEEAAEARTPEGEATVPETKAENEEAPEVVDADPTADEEEIVLDADGFAGLAEELEATRLERDQYLDSLRRLKAEFENSRKRQERERARILSMASERLVQELLPVLDNLDRALEAGGTSARACRPPASSLRKSWRRRGSCPWPRTASLSTRTSMMQLWVSPRKSTRTARSSRPSSGATF